MIQLKYLLYKQYLCAPYPHVPVQTIIWTCGYSLLIPSLSTPSLSSLAVCKWWKPGGVRGRNWCYGYSACIHSTEYVVAVCIPMYIELPTRLHEPLISTISHSALPRAQLWACCSDCGKTRLQDQGLAYKNQHLHQDTSVRRRAHLCDYRQSGYEARVSCILRRITKHSPFNFLSLVLCTNKMVCFPARTSLIPSHKEKHFSLGGMHVGWAWGYVHVRTSLPWRQAGRA